MSLNISKYFFKLNWAKTCGSLISYACANWHRYRWRTGSENFKIPLAILMDMQWDEIMIIQYKYYQYALNMMGAVGGYLNFTVVTVLLYALADFSFNNIVRKWIKFSYLLRWKIDYNEWVHDIHSCSTFLLRYEL